MVRVFIFVWIILSKLSFVIGDPDFKKISLLDGINKLVLTYFSKKNSEETKIFFNPSS